MKKPIILIATAVSLLLGWTSCNRVEDSGRVQFGMELNDSPLLKSAGIDRNISEALVTIVGENGQVLFDKETIPVYNFGDGYVTKSIKVPVGQWMLTEFMLLDSTGHVVWATPMEGSPLAHLVRQPLPLHFGVSADATTSLDIQVIRVKDHPPADFGYASFNIGFVDRFCLKVFYSSRCLDDWPVGVLGPDGTTMPVHQPRLTMFVNDRKVLDEAMNPGLNRYQIPMVNSWYVLRATDCRGNLFYEQKVHLSELVTHQCIPDDPPFMIFHESDPGVIITPEGLHEPTIQQGVFGRVAMPLDSYMVEGIKDVWPVVRDIYFLPYAYKDSIYTFAPMDCYFPFEDRMKPVTIVRTNSDGYFQVPLRAGEYLYLVKEGDRYYMDSFISSRLPGYVKVISGEVTELIINIVDCSMWM